MGWKKYNESMTTNTNQYLVTIPEYAAEYVDKILDNVGDVLYVNQEDDLTFRLDDLDAFNFVKILVSDFGVPEEDISVDSEIYVESVSKINEEMYDFVRDMEMMYGKGNDVMDIVRDLGRRLSKAEYAALAQAGVIRSNRGGSSRGSRFSRRFR